MTSKPALLLRRAARQLNLSPVLLQSAFGWKREERFGEALCAAAQPGDVVWDVGAFRGKYSRLLADRVGPQGRLYAFEPNPANFEAMRASVADRPWAVPLPLALGARCGTAPFRPDGGVGQVLEGAEGPDLIDVELSTGDALVAAGRATPPAVMKIDTEGLELDVLTGMPAIVASPATRAIFIEVHFQVLSARGADHVPGAIVRLLRDAGYRVGWIDPSHLAARRD